MPNWPILPTPKSGGVIVRTAAEGASAEDVERDLAFLQQQAATHGDAVGHLARALLDWGAAAIGGNCGNGPDELIPVIERMRAADPEAMLVAKSNAGMPELVDMRAVYRADPALMAAKALAMREAGARIVGGCCGSTPDHLRAMAEALTRRV